jgi:hypothetical protein
MSISPNCEACGRFVSPEKAAMHWTIYTGLNPQREAFICWECHEAGRGPKSAALDRYRAQRTPYQGPNGTIDFPEPTGVFKVA